MSQAQQPKICRKNLLISSPFRPCNHITRACEPCHLRKTRCNGRQPCKGCQQNHQPCIYRAGSARMKKTRLQEARTEGVGLLPKPSTSAATSAEAISRKYAFRATWSSLSFIKLYGLESE
ncbi:hypothetical protein ASPWEDRAFT_173269 [Aspergillus wentii DTO 134E9]|uniref:Zn(2)-C6 fungal-type domain-containing protein n=1 Tax=Aspergillus wentii DTO 134E9 TaxID=1073089 RepID=A0A1L9RFY5_ASPWE|nr:uncharacterized protein ASPWEDRAFT_173269 [Aspergillus wentii DTO 134E9]KAI9925594.1 hypothetical protein MW887_005976 [Aspergillus wentii]OJJ33835.1 hypothetical protein ASPWEDRAFT_173269 [Aspergillus wentii DTO 134E9]